MSVSNQSQSPNTSGKGRGNITRKKGKGKKRDNLAHPAQLNPVYHKHDLKEFLSSAFRDHQPAEHAGSKASLIVEPFSVCTLPSFVKDDQFLEGLKFELLDQIFYEKNNDLYTFQQSDDLKKISTPHVRALRKLLYEEFLDWVKDVTGVALTDTVDMTCSRYDYTDNLLCHDDELAGRRIAFILYLTPLWKAEDGGMLDLFDMDGIYDHQVIIHERHFVDPDDRNIHTQLIENTWMRAKKKLKRQHGTSVALFTSYIHEFIWRNRYKTNLFAQLLIDIRDILLKIKTEIIANKDYYFDEFLEHNQPKDVVRSILPQWNQLVWFEVTHASHHQVAEVLTKDKTRVSVGGWFHGPAVPIPKAYIESPLPLKSHGDIEEELHEWMNPIYLNIEVQGQIQERFESDSEIELQGFLKEDKYQEVIKALQDSDIDWSLQGPANKRHFHAASEKSLPEVVQRCIEFFQSEAMFLTLSNLTGLSLHALAAADSSSDSMPEEGSSSTLDAQPSDKEENNGEEYLNEEMDHSGSETEATLEKSKPRKKRRKLNTEGSVSEEAKIGQQKKECNPRCRAEVRKWSHGSYTLVHDTDAEGFQFALDAMLFCCCKGWQPEYGGYTSYIAKGEDEELLTVNPAENSLALVYRDKDTLRFVKYLNDRVKDMGNEQAFYDLSLCYYE